MALTIGPAVSRSRQRHMTRVTFLLAIFAGAIMSYGVLGLIENGLGHLAPTAPRAFVILVVGVAVVRDLGLRVPVPYVDLQVAEWLRGTLSPLGVAASYGWLLGLGFATKFTYSLHTALFFALPILLSPAEAVAVVATWSAARVLVTFVGSESDGPAQVCQYFASEAVRVRRLHWAAAAASSAAIVWVFGQTFS
jgi:hypothetical protein